MSIFLDTSERDKLLSEIEAVAQKISIHQDLSERIRFEQVILKHIPASDFKILIYKLKPQPRNGNVLKLLESMGKSGPPPVDPGRKRVDKKKVGAIWYCLELIPCGKANCKKETDHHGPYWYAYEWQSGSEDWRKSYCGRELPVLKRISESHLNNCLLKVRELSKRKVLNEEDKNLIDEMNASLRSGSGHAVAMVRQELIKLQEKYDTDLANRIYNGFTYLSDKVRRGEKLTTSERKKLKRYATFLSEEH